MAVQRLSALLVALFALATAALTSAAWELRWDLAALDRPTPAVTVVREWARVDDAVADRALADQPWGFPGVLERAEGSEGGGVARGRSSAHVVSGNLAMALASDDHEALRRSATGRVTLDGETEVSCQFDDGASPGETASELQFRRSRDRRTMQFRCRLPLRGPYDAVGWAEPRLSVAYAPTVDATPLPSVEAHRACLVRLDRAVRLAGWALGWAALATLAAGVWAARRRAPADARKPTTTPYRVALAAGALPTFRPARWLFIFVWVASLAHASASLAWVWHERRAAGASRSGFARPGPAVVTARRPGSSPPAFPAVLVAD